MTTITCDQCGKRMDSVAAVTADRLDEMCSDCWDDLAKMESEAVAKARANALREWRAKRETLKGR